MPDDRLITPPHSDQAEQSVLGGLMLSDVYERVADVLSESDFYALQHRVIYRHAAALATSSKPIDVVTLAESLRASGELDRAGGLEYLGVLVANVPTAANIEHYAEIVAENATRRRIMAAASEIAELAFDNRPVLELVDHAQRKIMAIGETRSDGGDAVRIGALLPHVVDEIEARVARGAELDGLSTGLADLDAKTNGLKPGDLVVTAGRPAMEKHRCPCKRRLPPPWRTSPR